MRLALLTAASFAAFASAQSTIVIPNGFAATEGNSSTSYPWQRTASVIHVQYCYDSTHFTNQGITYPILISRLRWRANGTTTTTTGGTYNNVSVLMSTSPLDQAVQTATFANNHGANLATVFNGSVALSATPSATPNVYYADLAITPFLYDPTVGDLVIDTKFPAASWTGTSAGAVDCQTTGSLVSRVYNLTSDTALTGTFQASVGPIIEVSYNPASGLYAGFSANVTSGPAPLTVNFTSNSYTSDPGGITSYAWDFDGDSVIDSTAQNPSFTYTTCGNFNVSLTVTDAVNPANTLTRNAYIQTDNLTANFTTTVTGPYMVQFTDTSSPAATAWAWDLDGDTIVDSTAQNPIWVYPNGNAVNVTLTATRNCKNSVRTASVVPLQQLTTNLAANNGVGAIATLYMNLNVTNPLGITINSFDTICQNLNTAYTAKLYLKIGSYVGSELNAAPWTLVGTASGTTGAVANTLSNAAFPQPVHIPFGQYGMAIHYNGPYPRYVTLPALTPFSNGDLTVTAGAASLATAGPFTGTNLNTPRGWCGTINYQTENVTGFAGHGFFGPGCPGTLGVSHQTYSSRPVVGGTLSVNCDAMPFGIGVMALGTSNTISGFGPLPVDLTFIGMPGCPLRVSLDATDTVVGLAPNATWNFAIPNNPALSGVLLYNQLAVLDTANAFGFVMGDAAGWVVGTL